MMLYDTADQLIDVPVNMRHRLDPAMANRHAAFLITEITTKVGAGHCVSRVYTR